MAELSPIIIDGHLLWPDGCISVDPDQVIDYIYKLSAKSNLSKLHVVSISPDIQAYNAVSEQKLTVKTSCQPPSLSWNLPEKYLMMDLDAFLLSLSDKIAHDDLYDKRLQRFSVEIYVYKQLKLDDVLRMLIYVVEVMTEKNVVWGVGRGSSCSSYLLYLMGLHEVDCVLYDIDLSDFLTVPNK